MLRFAQIAVAGMLALGVAGCAGSGAQALRDQLSECDLARDVNRIHLMQSGPTASFQYARVRLSHEATRQDGDIAMLVMHGEGDVRVGSQAVSVRRGTVIEVPAGTAYSAVDEIEALLVTRMARLVASPSQPLVAKRAQ